MLYSLPFSSTCESYAAGPGVSSTAPVQPEVGGLVVMLDMTRVRFSVPPNPALPALSSVREAAREVTEMLRKPFGSSYAPGSPVWLRSGGVHDGRAVGLDLKADEPASVSRLVAVTTGLYVPGPGMAVLRSLRALMRAVSASARCDGRIVRMGEVGRARDDGGIGALPPFSGELGLERDDGERERDVPRLEGEPGMAERRRRRGESKATAPTPIHRTWATLCLQGRFSRTGEAQRCRVALSSSARRRLDGRIGAGRAPAINSSAWLRTRCI